MARTFTLPKKGSGNWAEGWHTLTISKAAYGKWNDTTYIDVWFKDYPENFNMRIYAKIGKDNEEFAIGNLYRFADAGITDALESAEGDTVLKIDDSPEALIDKVVNVMFYKDGKFTRILPQIVPVEFTNIVDTFEAKDVSYYKTKAVNYFTKYVQPKLKGNTQTETVAETVTDDIPF